MVCKGKKYLEILEFPLQRMNAKQIFEIIFVLLVSIEVIIVDRFNRCEQYSLAQFTLWCSTSTRKIYRADWKGEQKTNCYAWFYFFFYSVFKEKLFFLSNFLRHASCYCESKCSYFIYNTNLFSFMCHILIIYSLNKCICGYGIQKNKF